MLFGLDVQVEKDSFILVLQSAERQLYCNLQCDRAKCG